MLVELFFGYFEKLEKVQEVDYLAASVSSHKTLCNVLNDWSMPCPSLC
ncbi:MAG: hypothetical protein QXR79_03695 [Candidatus Bathyarchaeia archaeon]